MRACGRCRIVALRIGSRDHHRGRRCRSRGADTMAGGHPNTDRGNTLATLVHRSGRPARIDSYDNVAGAIAARVRAVGVRAAVAVPIIVDSRVWGLAAVGSLHHRPLPADTEVRISRFAELIATALVAGYRDEQNRQLLAEASRRSHLIDSLLDGRAFDEWSLREVAGQLRLPIHGPFVVVAAHIPAAGDEPLPEIESKLRSLDVYSAWRLLPDVQVGIVHVTSDRKLDRVVAPAVADDDGAGGRQRALQGSARYATSPACGTSDGAGPDRRHLLGRGVRRLHPGHRCGQRAGGDDQTVGAALDGFGDLPDEDRAMLFETFRVWRNNDASVRGAAEVLICHPNTVRHRLRRIEKHTGRSLSRPRDVAELCLAFEVHRRLIEPKPVDTVDEREPPRGRGSIPHAGGSRHQHRCGAEIPATAGRHRSPHRRHAPDAAGQRGATPGNSISRGPLRNKKCTTGGWATLLAHRRQSPVVSRWVEPVESTIDFYRRNEREES